MQLNNQLHQGNKLSFMKSLFKPTAAVIFILPIFLLLSAKKKENKIPEHTAKEVKPAPKIQVAILLDVSNSMDGLIQQAKAQLWNMVSVMGKAKCNEVTPQIEIALYEYGRSSNDIKQGYVKQVSGFTNNLDELSKKLFGLTTNGGDEYCGHVIHNSVNQLNWDTAASNYKVIFIAGNEDFLQGDIVYTRACTEATKKGILINTIYCGDRMQGLQEHWNLGSECGGGSFTNINQDAKTEEIPTPYDSMLFVYNEKLNDTYIGYGDEGAKSYETQADMDKMNYSLSKSAAVQRIGVKGKKELYKNSNWDLVDKAVYDSVGFSKLDMKTLPDSLKNKSRKELEKIVKAKNIERSNIQQQIARLYTKRETFIANAKLKQGTKNADNTLETAIEKIIKQQARKHHMIID